MRDFILETMRVVTFVYLESHARKRESNDKQLHGYFDIAIIILRNGVVYIEYQIYLIISAIMSIKKSRFAVF